MVQAAVPGSVTTESPGTLTVRVRFGEAPDVPRAKQLLAALEAANACTATVLDLARVYRDRTDAGRLP